MDRATSETTRPASEASRVFESERLFDVVRDLKDDCDNHTVLHFHLSHLRSYNRQRKFLRAAQNSLEIVAKHYAGDLFCLPNDDFVLLVAGAGDQQLERVVLKLRYLFNEDPLADVDSDGEITFCTRYALARDYDSLAQFSVALKDGAPKTSQKATCGKPVNRIRKSTGRALKPSELEQVEESLAQADVSNVVRRQSVFAMIEGATPQPVYKEVFVSIKDLQELLLPGVDFLADRWLFMRLSSTLDARVLSFLSRNDDSDLSQYIGVNLNVSTLLDRSFRDFGANLTATARATMVIELQMVDIFSDLCSFAFARDYVRERGYRVCLDGTSLMTVPYVDRERLGLDLVKIYWDKDIFSDGGTGLADQVLDAVQRIGPERVILCRCGGPEALEFGNLTGIALYQGRHIDKINTGIAPTRIKAPGRQVQAALRA